MNQVKVNVTVGRNDLITMFNFVNSHLTIMETASSNQIFEKKEDQRKVRLPKPITKSKEEYLSRFLSSQPKRVKKKNLGSCRICLEQVVGGEMVRTLKCGHGFHMGCVDEWLDQNRDCLPCPICRLSQYEDKFY